MVGDSTWDCEAAKRAGVATIGVLTGGFSEPSCSKPARGVFSAQGAARKLARTTVYESIVELHRRPG